MGNLLAVPTPVHLLIGVVPADGADRIRRNISEMASHFRWDRWTYEPEVRLLEAAGVLLLEREADAADVCVLADHAWDALGRFCEVHLVVNPGASAEVVWYEGESGYREYLWDRRELDHECRREWLRAKRAGRANPFGELYRRKRISRTPS